MVGKSNLYPCVRKGIFVSWGAEMRLNPIGEKSGKKNTSIYKIAS